MRSYIVAILALSFVTVIPQHGFAQSKSRGRALCLDASGQITLAGKKCSTPLSLGELTDRLKSKIELKPLEGPRGPQGAEGPRGPRGEKGTLDLSSCHKISSAKNAVEGNAEITLSCGNTTEFMLNDGYWVVAEDGVDVYTRTRELLYVSGIPSGVSVNMGAFDDGYSLHVDIICCKQ